jgi:xanthine/CO dehydrogenase XdhC/CoxF family maturation factor
MRRVDSIAETGQACVVRYNTSSDHDIILGTGMGCGGTVSMLLEPADSAGVRFLVTTLYQCMTTSRSSTTATVYETAGPVNVRPGERITLNEDEEISGTLSDDRLHGPAVDSLRVLPLGLSHQNVTWQTPGAVVKALIDRIQPSTRLVLFGAGDDAIPVHNLANALGWQVTVVDPRPSYATSERFPGAVEVKLAHPEDVGDLLASHYFDAAVIMTHNYHRDLQLLKRLLPASIGYVGLLGARTRVNKMLQDLADEGSIPPAHTRRRLHAPVGLNIGAEGPEEIALAIIAEIQMVLRAGTGLPLRDITGAGMSSSDILQESRH